MKCALILLLTAFGTAAYAQPVYRCADRFGNIAYQDRSCTEPLPQTGANPARPGEAGAPMAAVMMASFDGTRYGQGGWNHWDQRQRNLRRLQSKIEGHALALRAQTQVQSLNDRKAVQYAENQRRCQNAMQVAALCGKFAGRFYCDGKGFRKAITQDSSLKRPVISNGYQSAFKMEQCAKQAMKGN